MLWSSDAVEHECYYVLGMDDLVGRSRTLMLSSFLAWIPRSSDAVEHGRLFMMVWAWMLQSNMNVMMV